MKFSIEDFFNNCDQICSFLRIWSHLLKKSIMENFIFCTVIVNQCRTKNLWSSHNCSYTQRSSKFSEQNKFITPTFIHNKSKGIIKKKLKINSVILKGRGDRTYSRNRLCKLSLILRKLFLKESIFKVTSLDLFSLKPKFH